MTSVSLIIKKILPIVSISVIALLIFYFVTPHEYKNPKIGKITVANSYGNQGVYLSFSVGISCSHALKNPLTAEVRFIDDTTSISDIKYTLIPVSRYGCDYAEPISFHTLIPYDLFTYDPSRNQKVIISSGNEKLKMYIQHDPRTRLVIVTNTTPDKYTLQSESTSFTESSSYRVIVNNVFGK